MKAIEEVTTEKGEEYLHQLSSNKDKIKEKVDKSKG